MRMLRSNARPPLAALLLTCLAVVAAPAGASAATGTGSVKVGVGGKGKAAKALARAGVEVGAIRPAKKRGARIALPVRSVAVGGSATVALRGGIAFRAGARTAKLKSVRLALGARRAKISAKAGRRRLAVFAAALPAGRAKLDRAKVSAKLAGAKLALTPRGAKLLRAKLGADAIVAGALGTLAVDARPDGGGTGGGTKPGAGGPGGGVPESGPIKNVPPVMARPPTAVDVSDIAIAWYPRDSWVRYLTSGVGPQDGSFVDAGATKLAPMTTGAHPCSDVPYGGAPSETFDYGFGYAPKSGWFDPPSQTAAIYGQGVVAFRWKTHTIDLTASDPEIELDPSNPRAIFRFNGSGGTAYPNQRAALTKLDLAGQPTVAGNTRTYTAVRGRLTDDGQAVFAGFYPPPGDEFGCVTVSFTTP